MALLATSTKGAITQANEVAAVMFGYGVHEIVGLPMAQLFSATRQQGELLRTFIVGEETKGPGFVGNDTFGRRKDGSLFAIDVSVSKMHDNKAATHLFAVRDMTRKDGDQLANRPGYDFLTGLPTRAFMQERISNALLRSRRSGLSVALLFINLDGTKLINDTYGHEAGDLLLSTVASKLRDLVRPDGTVARLDGDEFVILCEQVDQPDSMSALAQRINLALRQPFAFKEKTFSVTASVGIAIGGASTHTSDEMLRHSAAAMHVSKGRGPDRWQFFDEEIHRRASERAKVAAELAMALEREEFSPRFQPIVLSDSGRIVGAELLLRWHPASGEISPAVFIPIAEMTGTIVPIGIWVFRRACQAAAEWRQRWGNAAPYVSVNVSVRQLNVESMAEDFATILLETRADPAQLLLEITETALMTDIDTNLRMLGRLAALGLRIAVDDFGTGYSSLAQLTRMPVNVLKIDKAFIDQIEKSPESRAVVRAIIGLGRALGLKLVAEGVETSGQQLELCGFGCDLIQGYYFHRPLLESGLVQVMDQQIKEGTPSASVHLHFLLYVSQAVSPMCAADLDALLKQTRHFNRSTGITGCLIYQDGFFMQMLEGRHQDVHALYDKIKNDPRHVEVRVVIDGPAKRRVFIDWAMALRDLTPGPNEPQFAQWQRRKISFLELADDARTCYAYITSLTHAGGAH
ncbi:EAL domain-containing protein [Massilia sp. P8910]|nr:EAL domain-containing protein [Massilia antarctica]